MIKIETAPAKANTKPPCAAAASNASNTLDCVSNKSVDVSNTLAPPFDKAAYQREYMRKRRAEKKAQPK